MFLPEEMFLGFDFEQIKGTIESEQSTVSLIKPY
jgi:hypothetical protein